MRTFIILLFISFSGFSQITLQDVLDIEDRRSFQKLMIENNFQQNTDGEYENIKNLISYRKDAIDGTVISFAWLDTDSLRLGGVTGYFSENMFGVNEIYDAIYDEVKKGCTFMDIMGESPTGKDVAYYNCPDANADPRFIEMDEKIKKDYPEVWDRGYRATDLQIGFTKKEEIFIIECPSPEYEVEEMIEITNMMLELYKQSKE